jgi:hypothetical protein
LTCGNGVLDTSLGEVCDPAGAMGGHVRTRLFWVVATQTWLDIPDDYCYSCNDTCSGWIYTEPNSVGSVCAPYVGYCGDGIKQQLLPLTSGWEQCDGSDVFSCPACTSLFLPNKACTSGCNCFCDIAPAMSL